MRYLENPGNYEHVADLSPIDYPKKQELPKIAKDVFSRLLPNQSIGDNVLDSENENTSEPSVKKSKSELNDISCETDDQNSDYIHENALTHIMNEMTFYEATKECPKI